jgi:aldose 1-epimerase
MPLSSNHSRPLKIGGEELVVLRPRVSAESQPRYTEAIVAPGRGMELLGLRAWNPNLGDFEVLHTVPPERAAPFLNEEDDESGTNAFRIGGAILVPWANRIRGDVSPDGRKLIAEIGDRRCTLATNWSGERPGAERHAIHGLMLRSAFRVTGLRVAGDVTEVEGSLDAADFGGRWFSSAAVSVSWTLALSALRLAVTVTNTGSERLPIAIGWHPYFNLPGGDRKRARLRLPASQRALVNNYDDSFPTGEFENVAGTPYDFRNGAPLGELFMDDSFTSIERDPEGRSIVEITDPDADHRLRLAVESPQVKAFQIYALPTRSLIAVEPQFNLNDPFSKIWQGRDTGIKWLDPDESTSYKVTLELF